HSSLALNQEKLLLRLTREIWQRGQYLFSMGMKILLSLSRRAGSCSNRFPAPRNLWKRAQPTCRAMLLWAVPTKTRLSGSSGCIWTDKTPVPYRRYSHEEGPLADWARGEYVVAAAGAP